MSADPIRTLDGVPADVFAALAFHDVAEAVARGVRFDAEVHGARFDAHPDLQTGPQVLDALRRTRWVRATTEAEPAPRSYDADLALWLCERLTALRYTPAIATIAALLAPERDFLPAAGRALLRFDDPAALAAVAATLAPGDVAPNDWHRYDRQGLAVEALFRLGAGRAFEALAPRFGAEALAARGPLPGTADLALAALTPERALADRRWLDLCAALRRHRTHGARARALLERLDPEVVREAIARATPRPAAKAPRGRTAARDLLARYRAGEHERVWQDLSALGLAPSEAAAAELDAIADEAMRRVRANLEHIVAALTRARYPFHARERALAAPDPDAAVRLDALERLVGGPLPRSLRSFYMIVGAVDLSGDPDRAARASAALAPMDPLVVLPLSWGVDAAERWHAHTRDARPELRPPFELVLSPALPYKLHPATAPAAAPDVMRLPGPLADGEVALGRGGTIRFVDYLRRCLRWGGFPGLAAVTTPPAALLARLTRGLQPF